MQTIAILLVGGYAALTVVVVFFFFTGHWEYVDYITHNIGRVYLYAVFVYAVVMSVCGLARAVYRRPLYYYGLGVYCAAELCLLFKPFSLLLSACSLLVPAFIRTFLYSKWIQAQMTYNY